jgi:hypothetical protein
MVETMGTEITASRSPLMVLSLTKFHENPPSGSKDIQSCFIPKAINTLRTFLPYSKQLSVVAMVISQHLCRFCPTVNDLHLLPQ